MLKEDLKLAKVLTENNIKSLTLTSIGNSIASGYSYMDITKPLLYRDEIIEKVFKDRGITLNRYHFARYANNNDEHVYSWFMQNISLQKMNHLNRIDTTILRTIGLTSEKIEEYYPIDSKETLGMQDIILSKSPNLANIVIYNGATGSFLDNVTRKGKHKFTAGIKRDCTSIEATLKAIQINNRLHGSNTQVYLCGAPRILNTPITDIFINSRLEKLANNYANVTYVSPISRKILYCNSEYGISPDTHYNEEEYQRLISKIIESISKNYPKTMAMIDLDRNFFKISSEIETGKSINKDVVVESLLNKWLYLLQNQNIDINQFLIELRQYLLERQPYDFYYIGNKTIKKQIGSLIK